MSNEHDGFADPVEVSSDFVRISDLVDQVLVGFGGRVGDEIETQYGAATPVVLERMVAFGRDGEIEWDEDDFLVFQSRLKKQFCVPQVIGKLRQERGGGAYFLEPVGPGLKKRAAAAIAAADKAGRPARQVHPDPLDDGGDDYDAF